MRNILIDTNVLISIVRSTDVAGITQFINPTGHTMYISVVSEAEINSIAIRRNWGTVRQNKLRSILESVTVLDITQRYVNIYAQIDAYSQKSNPNYETYGFDTPRNMGKNDLWIAAQASFLSLTLVTMDADFDHLNNVFFEVNKITTTDLIPFL